MGKILKVKNEIPTKKNFKPVMAVKDVNDLHPLFYKQFLTYYSLSKKKKNEFPSLVFSGLFLYLTLETYIIWIIRELFIYINRRKSRRMATVWENHFVGRSRLTEKIQFFADAFLDSKSELEIKKIKKLVENIGELRHKIVHGHEFSVWRWSDGKIDKSKAAELLEFKKVEESYSDFKRCINLITLLLERIDIEKTISGTTKKWVIDHLTFET